MLREKVDSVYSPRGRRSSTRSFRTFQPVTGVIFVVFRVLFIMCSAFMFSRGVETIRIDGYLKNTLLTNGNLAVLHRLMKYVEPISMARAHASPETYSYKCVAGLKMVLVEYLLMQNRHLRGNKQARRLSSKSRR